jgi:hypothetical protein
MSMADESAARASWRVTAIEIATSFVVSVLFVLACANIRGNAMDRYGQVSLGASVQLRLLCFAIPILLALVIAARVRRGAHFPLATRLVCAALAGLSTAAVAGGILAILARTKFGLGGQLGDSGVLIWWGELVRGGDNAPGLYPPGQVHLLVGIADLLHIPTAYAIKWFQIVGCVLLGPCAYAAWRLLLRPAWALALGVVASLTLVEAYRSYPYLILIVFIPVAIKFLDVLRRSPALSSGELVRSAVSFGIAFGVMFLMYSGWFQWSAPGFVVAAAVVFPWRRWRAGTLLCAVTAIVFVLISLRYLIDIAQAPPIRDEYFYFDATVEPAYIAMWRGGLHGITGTYPPIGELGGVGVFTVILTIGTGAAIVFGRGHTFVIALLPIMAGAWLLRFWHAHNMYAKQLVQLYPRTTAELFYCAVILTIAALYFILERIKARAPGDSPLHAPTAVIGVCTGFFFLAMSTSSSTVDKYMPKETRDDLGHPAWVALKTPMLHESQVHGATIDVSSSYNDAGYSVGALIDGKPATAFSSQLGITHDHEEWVMVTVPSPREFSKIVLVPAADGFPVDLEIDLWDGTKWLPRIALGDLPEPSGPQTYHFMMMEATSRLRVRATKLRKVGNDYVLRLAGIELLR